MKKDIFKNLSTEALEKLLTDCNIKFEKVEPGKGGVFIGSEHINIRDFYEKQEVNNELEWLSKLSKQYTVQFTSDFSCFGYSDFFIEKDEYFIEAA